MLNVQFSALDEWWADYRDVLPEAFDTVGLKTHLAREIAPTEVDYLIFAANGPVQDLTPYSRLKAVLNLWAGVEEALKNHTLSQPLVRMVDPGLTEGMVDWVVGHVMRLHLGMDVHLFGQDGEWRKKAPPLAREQKITIMGLGELGQACAKALAGLNFQVSGWSRTLKDVPRVKSLAGNDGFKTALADADYIISLLPLTDATRGIFDAQAFAKMKPGARFLNPGRGGQVVDADLIAALDSGQLDQATLDVFNEEPLPRSNPYWDHPKVTVTPHIASVTRASSAAHAIATNIRRCEDGMPMIGLVDRSLGY